MRVDNRREPRLRAHWRVELRWAEGAAEGTTENLSARGAMLSVVDDPALETGEPVRVTLHLPGDGGSIEVGARVRWVSEMLPNTLGIEFDEPLPRDALEALRPDSTTT